MLFRSGEVLAEKSWTENKEAENLIPAIAEMVGDRELDRILVVSGPGPFTALRVGIVTANTIAKEKGVELRALKTFELFPGPVLLNGGGLTAISEDEIKPVNEFDGQFYVDLTEKQLLAANVEILDHELNFSEIVARMPGEKIETLPLLPYYVKEPTIT